MIALGLYLASHWALAGTTTLVVIALGVVAFLLKNLKLAGVAVLVALGGFLFQGVTMHGINLQIAKDAAAQVQILKARQEALQTLVLKDAVQAKADAAVIEELESSASETPKNDGVCLDAAAAGRVRAIGSTPNNKPVAHGPGGLTGLLPKRSR